MILTRDQARALRAAQLDRWAGIAEAAGAWQAVAEFQRLRIALDDPRPTGAPIDDEDSAELFAEWVAAESRGDFDTIATGARQLLFREGLTGERLPGDE